MKEFSKYVGLDVHEETIAVSLAADFANTDILIPWLANKKLRFTFG